MSALVVELNKIQKRAISPLVGWEQKLNEENYRLTVEHIKHLAAKSGSLGRIAWYRSEDDETIIPNEYTITKLKSEGVNVKINFDSSGSKGMNTRCYYRILIISITW